jgi:hypothetical protein
VNKEQANELLAQIGKWNVLAISGGRALLKIDPNDADEFLLVLPVGKGYRVEIELTAADDYTVRRVYKRGAKEWVKGEVAGVYCDQIGEIAYQASCYVNVEFGKEPVA